MVMMAFAAAPPASSIIGNQASATYTDGSGQAKSATSNLVETTVRQVGSLTLTQNNSKTASIGNTVYMSHLLTNTGNGADSFTLSTADVVTADTDFATGISIYADTNGDGLPDSATPLCSGIGCSAQTPILSAGASYGFVVSMTVPSSAVAAQFDGIVVSASGNTLALYDGNNNGVFGEVGDNLKSNTDVLTVTAGAAFQVSKVSSLSQGPAGAVLTYTLTYQNTGTAAGNLALRDVIGSGSTAGLSYVAGSAVWSAGASVLTDAYTVGTPDVTVGGSEAHYQALTVGGVTTINATLTNIGPNVTGTVTIRATVLATASVGTAGTSNTALYGLDADADPTNNTLSQASNTAIYQVVVARGLVVNDGTQSSGVPVDGNNTRPAVGDTDTPANADLVYQANASPGQTLSFPVTVWNLGNTTDSFNVVASNLAGGAGYGTWPSGTSIQLFKSDGVTPLVDSSNDGVPDTGPLAAASSASVIVKVTLPPGACTGACPSGPFDVQLNVTSTGDSTQSSSTFVRLGSLTLPTVDLAHNSGTVDPTVNQDAIGSSPTVTQSVLPAGTTTFDLVLRNESAVSDTYALAYSTSASFAPMTALPAGWSVQFRTADSSGACSATGGTVLSSAGPVAPGAELKVCAVVVTASGAPAGDTNLYFQVKSQVTGATDSLFDRVTVSSVNQLSIQPNHTGQVFPGGTVVYAHTLSNTGNTSCGSSFALTVGNSVPSGWNAVVYRDVNGDGQIDSSDLVIDPAVGLTGVTLAPGQSVSLLVKVFASSGLPAGSADVVSLAATATCGATAIVSNTAADTTTVVTGQVRLVKMQAIDHNCDGTPSLPSPDPAGRTAGAAFSATPMQAIPGECIVYRVMATNEGLGTVTTLALSDSRPAFTLFNAGPTCTAGTADYTAPTFSCSGISLAPAAVATMEFRVQVQP